MKWSDLPLNPSPKTLRQFAALWLVFFLGSGCWQWLGRGRPTVGVTMVALALIVGVAGLLVPALVRWIFVGWIVAAFPIGWVVSQLMLGLLFYGIFTPIGLISRIAGRDALYLRPRQPVDTYWTPKPSPQDVRRYFKQF